jgi:hypothetical protein
MTDVPLVYGPLSSFIDRDNQVDLELTCLSNMSITILFVLNISINPVLLNFISNHFDLTKGKMDEENYKHATFAFHGPDIADKTHLVNFLSSGSVNFIPVYDIMNGSIFGSEIDDNGQLTCHNVDTKFSAVGLLGLSL